MVISGDRDRTSEVENDIGNTRWEESGLYDDETGMFFLREGEYVPIQRHFKMLRVNRL